MKSTVDLEVYSIDEEGVFTCEKRDHPRDFVWCGGPADREAVTKSCYQGLVFHKINSGVGRRETRCHGVDPHALRAVFKRQGARKVGNGSLCRIISTKPPISAQTGC
jgi:hypothetical protein